MTTEKLRSLMGAVVAGSFASTWDQAVFEWDVTDVDEDPTSSNMCVCGQPDLVLLYTIRNRYTGAVLFPIGSTCVNHFGRRDLNQQIAVLKGLLRLRGAIEARQPIVIEAPLFSKAMLNDLYEQGAFTPDQWNYQDGSNDLAFLLRMFNKRDRAAISGGQRRKAQAIIMQKIVPFVLNDPRLGG